MKRLLTFLRRLIEEWPPRQPKPDPKCRHCWTFVGWICSLRYYQCESCRVMAAECPTCLDMHEDPPILGVSLCPECGNTGKVSSDRGVEMRG